MTPATFKAIRERTGHTRASLAAWLRVSKSQVESIEQGRRAADGPVALLMELLDAGKV